jgi:hypothetical protein
MQEFWVRVEDNDISKLNSPSHEYINRSIAMV